MSDAPAPQNQTAIQPASNPPAVYQPQGPALMSPEIDQLAAAVAAAKGAMFSPVRNKHVTVKKGGVAIYDFRYTSLDVINDMLRLPLFENGLSVLHIMRPNARGALFMATRLLHRSGQYMDSVLPILHAPGRDARSMDFADGDGATASQKLGSLISFAKRYNLCALLDIAGQEDDDNNIAEGNLVIDHEFPVEPNAQARVLQDRYSRLVTAAANARDPAGVGEVLQRWQKGFEFWDRMRLEGNVESWDKLMELIPAGLARVHHPVLGRAFHDAAIATTGEAVDLVRALWESAECVEARAAMKALNAFSYGLLLEHLRMQAARVEREAEEEAERRRKQAEALAMLASVREEGSPFDASAGELVQAPLEHEPDMSYRQVRNELGETISDTLSEVEWARVYADEYRNAGNPEAVREHNADGLVWAERIVEAQVVLMQELGRERFAPPASVESTPPAESSLDSTAPAAVEEPAIADDPRQLQLLADIPTVTLHQTARGTPDLSRFVRAVKISLDQVDTDNLPQWEQVNMPTVDGLPRGTQFEIMGLLARRKQTLGVAA